MEGWIKIHRRLLDWEWAGNPSMVALWIHLLLTASHEERKWQGRTIGIGQVATSLDRLSRETGLTVQQIRTCLTRLKSTDQITSESTNGFTLITICNYESYQHGQDDEQQADQQAEQQTDNKRSTTSKEGKNKEERDIDKSISRKKDDQRTLQEREKDFYNSLIPYVQTYGPDMVRRFFNYWSQVNPNGKKMLWEMQKVFDIKKRLVTWNSKETKIPDANKTKMSVYEESLQKIMRGEKL